MDTAIWGPLVWSILQTVAYRWDTSVPENVTTIETDTGVFVHMSLFLKSLASVLPCIHCRDNYRRHLEETHFLPHLKRHTLLRWVFELHEVVNVETKKPTYNEKVQVNRDARDRDPLLGFATLVKKLEVYTSDCTIQQVLDLLYIISTNLHVMPTDMTSKDKIMWHIIFLQCLPDVISLVPSLAGLSRAWDQQLAKTAGRWELMVLSDLSMVAFLNGLDRSNMTVLSCPSLKQTLEKYRHAQAEYLPDVQRWYPSS